MSLFADAADRRLRRQAPLAARLRPRTLDEVVGQEHLVGPGAPLRVLAESDRVGSAILWGPAGTGKTTLARLLADATAKHLTTLSATGAGVKDVREALADAERRLGEQGQGTMLFIDEVHRFSKSQQDVLLPAVEDGLVVLIGATTENPFFEVNPPLLSRASLWRLHPLSPDNLRTLIRRGLDLEDADADAEAIDAVVAACEGDARAALTTVEVAVALARAARADPTPGRRRRPPTRRPGRAHDGRHGPRPRRPPVPPGRRRALRPDQRADQERAGLGPRRRPLLDGPHDRGGEDPRFLARRMVILASEDIGLADPQALLVAEAAARAVEYVGLPEAALNLAEAVIYLARAPKSNAVVVALGRAQADVRSGVTQEVPAHLRDAHYKGAATLGHGEGYVYPHDDPSGVVRQQYRPDALEGRVYYEPTPHGAGGPRDGSRPRQGGRFVKRGQRQGRCSAPLAAVRSGRSALAAARSLRLRRPVPPSAGAEPRVVAAPGGADHPGRHDAPRARAGGPGARPRRRPGRAERRRPGPGGGGGVDPRSPDYHHYLTRGAVRGRVRARARAEVAQVSSALRGEGLTVGTPDRAASCCPVRGTAAVVSAAFGTPLESVQAPSQAAGARQHRVAAGSRLAVGRRHRRRRPQRAVPGARHAACTRPAPAGAGGAGAARARPRRPAEPRPAVAPRRARRQACAARRRPARRRRGIYTSTQMATIFGLDQLFAQGRTGVGQTIAIVEFEQYLAERLRQRSSPATACPTRSAT